MSPFFRLLWVVILLGLGWQFLASQVFAAQRYQLTGQLFNESRQGIAGAQVTLAGASSVTDQQGQFVITTAKRENYQLTFSQQGYFSNIQTFSHFELLNKNKDEDKSSAVIAPITLVKKAKNRVMLAFGGDVMMGRRYYQPYFGDAVLIHPQSKLTDSMAIVENIKPYMSLADYAAVNLETQVANKKPDERAPKSVTFYSQPEVLDALSWAGIDYVSLGNNHTYDYMDSGLHSTLDFLSKSQLAYSGAGINEQQALKAHQQKIKDVPFSMLGYVGWEGSADPTQTANDQHGGAAYGSMENMLASVKREVAQDKVTLVQYHGSQEYANNPTGVTEHRLKSALDVGAALAVAHHPHVTQGLELYNGKLIAYSMGNFIFDQNFSATQHSFILYVWLDGEKFHRAEIVPLYVKGYKPTPATGMHRYTVMKRLTELSKDRNTHISQSGGHGVISADNQAENTPVKHVKLTLAQGEKIAALYNTPWQKNLSKVSLADKNLSYRLGTNLINGSDFEHFNAFNSVDRGWLFDRSITSINNYGASGESSLGLALSKNQPTTFGMQSFRRVYNASSSMTIKANFKSNKVVKASFYWQGRKTRQKLFDAFENSEKHLIKTVQLNGDDNWQALELGFNSPRIGYKSYRVLVEFELENGERAQVDIDDFSLIEWQTAYSNKPTPALFTIKSKQAAFIGLNKHTSNAIKLSF